GRWWQLGAGIGAMMAIANLQYAWTLFTVPLTQSLHATLSAVQVAFTLFILTETWLVPFEGYLVDRLGARLIVTAGSVLVGLGWIGWNRRLPGRALRVVLPRRHRRRGGLRRLRGNRAQMVPRPAGPRRRRDGRRLRARDR